MVLCILLFIFKWFLNFDVLVVLWFLKMIGWLIEIKRKMNCLVCIYDDVLIYIFLFFVMFENFVGGWFK